MNTTSVSTVIFLMIITMIQSAYAADLNGIWSKTTHADRDNRAIVFQEKNSVKAIGYGKISGAKAAWHAFGRFEGQRLRLQYHYSADAIPPGWEQKGVMVLDLSEDGKILAGTATSASGNWSGSVIFKRLR
jgi:hypothetical protein